jgi:antirestriction protein ArdC
VAELGSAFLTARCGLPHHTQANAAYVASWLRVLRGDTRAVFTAARLAQQAADCIAPAQDTGASGGER